MCTDHFRVSRPGPDGYFVYLMVHVGEASFFNPALEVLARRAMAADLVTGGGEDVAEFNDLIIGAFAAVFAVSKGVEVLKLYPTAGGKVTS